MGFKGYLTTVIIGRGTHPTERAFYRVFSDFNPQNDLEIGWKPRDAAVSSRAVK